MRFSLLGLVSLLVPLTWAADAAHWASQAAKSPEGIISVNGAGYDELLAGEDGVRDYGVTVILTALPAQYKCTPCHEFQPVFRTVAASWNRVPKDQRAKHFFAQLDFSEGQEIFQRLGLQSAPTLYYYPPTTGAKASKGVQNYDLNRAGLSLGNLHMWVRSTTPVHFEIYKPMSPVPFIIAPLVLAIAAYAIWNLRAFLVPIVTSRFVWGICSMVSILIFTTGHMWVKIKSAPYVQASREGTINWIAGGYSNQLGLEGQVMAALYGMAALCVIVLTVLIPAQSSPNKQRVGTILWVGMLVALFSIIMRIFKMKNGGYPFTLL